MRVLALLPAAAVACFSLYWIIGGKFESRLSGLTSLDWLALGALPLAIAYAYVCTRVLKRRGITLAERFVLGTITLIATASVAGVTLSDPEDKSSLITLMVGLFAIVGWLYTNYINIKNATTAHTMNVLIQMRNSAELNKHRDSINRHIADGKVFDDTMLRALIDERKEDRKDHQAKIYLEDSIVYVLNYYEFICAGITLGDLNERLIRNTMRYIFVKTYNITELYVRTVVAEPGNERLWEHFRGTVARFRTQ